MTTWVVRAGVMGERDGWALEKGLAAGGFNEYPDLTSYTTREALHGLTAQVLTGEHPQKIATFVGQLWALRSRISPGDLVLLPLKTTKRIAFGKCTGGYRYLSGEPEDRRHAIAVEWLRSDIPRSALKDDLLNMINGALTIFSPTRNNADSRLHQILESGSDPGFAASPTQAIGDGSSSDALALDPAPAITMEAVRDTVRIHLAENFSGHKLTALIADILKAKGYTCEVSPAGPDFGVDILAGRGPLGLDGPTLVVEVKSESAQVGVPVLNQLQGAVTSHRADQGLLVAWGGLSKQAEQLRMTQRLKVRVWTDEDVLDQLFETYDRLSESIRIAIPMKRAWILAQETG